MSPMRSCSDIVMSMRSEEPKERKENAPDAS
jgi:hypothetical protein